MPGTIIEALKRMLPILNHPPTQLIPDRVNNDSTIINTDHSCPKNQDGVMQCDKLMDIVVDTAIWWDGDTRFQPEGFTYTILMNIKAKHKCQNN